MVRPMIVTFLLAACSGSPGTTEAPPTTDAGPQLREIVGGLDSPVYLTSAPGDSRLYVVEQTGRIRIVDDGRLVATPFLDLSAKVSTGGERGLLSVAFHPDYATNGYLFVDYTDRAGDTRVERYRVSADRSRADPASAKLILSVGQPYSNHNGGLLLFGADGMLYIGLGDGGSGGDPHGNGQSTSTLLGKILRIDVDSGDPYAVPADNPFVGRAGARGEIWAFGLRNPWRFSFDNASGLLYIADVGQNQWEEVDVVPADRGGLNFGWNTMEARHCYRSDECDAGTSTLPVVEYPHSEGCSVTGGYVYRGQRIPSLDGHYFYADYCEGWVRSFVYSDGAVTEEKTWNFGDVGQIQSFGLDARGELYVLSRNGGVYELVPG